jgi:hypothetical protein
MQLATVVILIMRYDIVGDAASVDYAFVFVGSFDPSLARLRVEVVLRRRYQRVVLFLLVLGHFWGPEAYIISFDSD